MESEYLPGVKLRVLVALRVNRKVFPLAVALEM
jgi:hypothetical protein